MFRQCPLRVGSVSFPSTDRVHRLTSYLELFVELKLELLEFFDALVHIVLRRANYAVGNSSVRSAQVRGHLVLSVRGWVADPPRGPILRSYRMYGIIFRLCVWMRAFPSWPVRASAGGGSSFDGLRCSCRWPSIAFFGCVGCFFRHIFRQDDFVYVGLCCFDRLSSRFLFGRVSRFVSSFRVVCGSSFFLTCLASPSFFCAFLARTTSPCFRMSHSNCRISSAKLACGSMVLPLSRSSGWNWVWIVSWFPLSSGRGSSGSTNRWRVGWSRTEHPERCHPLSIPFERRNEKGKGEVGSSTFLGATPTPRFDSFPPGLVRSEPVEQPYATPLRVPRKGRWRRNHPNPHVPKETNTRLTSIAKHPTWHPRRKKPSKKRCPC